MKRLLILAITFTLIYACKKDDNSSSQFDSNVGLVLPDSPFDYTNANLPRYLTQGPVNAADNTPSNNPVTNEGATLGRMLFYDKNFSLNRTISCGSCHLQEKGFSDPLEFSDGFNNGKTKRHSMALANARYYNNGRFFWDERANTLEEQVLLPIQDPVEMGMNLDSLIERLNALDYYPDLFTSAFGNSEINTDRVSKALAQFIRSMVSYNSKYDVGRVQVQNANQNFPNFSQAENNGKRLYLSRRLGCNVCHNSDAFIAPGARNNGLDLNTTDAGVGGITNNANDNGEFKVGSLKNIALTAPYMHDGRFNSLQEVIDHYSNGVKAHPNLSPPLRGPNGQPRVLNLSQNEKSDLLAFLHTLTDDVMINAVRFSDPFPD